MVATTAFAFSLVIVLLVPFLPHVGSVEVSGLGVLLTFGTSRSHAVGSFMALRVLSTGVNLLVLHREVGATLRRLSPKRKPGTTSTRANEYSSQKAAKEERNPRLEPSDQGAEAPSPRQGCIMRRWQDAHEPIELISKELLEGNRRKGRALP